MLFDGTRQTGRDAAARSRRRAAFTTGLETLERRELLSWSPLYKSLPDLTVSGIAAPVAAYGQEMDVTVDVRNLGANTFPLYQQQRGAPSTADSPPATVVVYASSKPHFSNRSVVKVGSFEIPSIRENSLAQFTASITLPQASPKLPAEGGTVFLYFRVNTSKRPIPDFDPTNNLTRRGVPVQTAPALPDLFGYSLDTPPVMQAGDTIRPTVQVVNYGTVNPDTQGSFDVILVASDDQFYGPGDVVLARTTVTSLAPLSSVPMANVVLGDVNIDTPINVTTLAANFDVVLPSTPSSYFIGVVVDPENTIQEISELGRGPDPILNPIKVVGPGLHAFPPAGPVMDAAPPDNLFPYPPFGPIPAPDTGAALPADVVVPVEQLPLEPDFVIRSQRQGAKLKQLQLPALSRRAITRPNLVQRSASEKE